MEEWLIVFSCLSSAEAQTQGLRFRAGSLLASRIPDSIDDVLVKQKTVFNKMMPSSQIYHGKIIQLFE